MSKPVPEVIEAYRVDNPGNILWQNDKDLSVSKVFANVNNILTTSLTAAEQPPRLKLWFPVGLIPDKVRIQARIICDKSYASVWNNQGPAILNSRWTSVTFDAGVSPLYASAYWYSAANRLGFGSIPLELSEPAEVWQREGYTGAIYAGPWPLHTTFINEVELEFDVIEPYYNNELWLGMRIMTNNTQGGLVVSPEHIPNATTGNLSSSRVVIEVHSITIEGRFGGCEDVTVQSLDGRLVSNSDDTTITYPILFLNRRPVKEDAQGLDEVLVFQDRATTLRVTPQPLVLNEENRYTVQGLVESNGNWALYDFDREKLECHLESGRDLMAGAGNDVLTLVKSPDFIKYGLYDSTLLFSTDTDDEPYVVPVVLDYARPLAVSAPPQVDEPQTRIVTVYLDDYTRRINLHIFRDREWKIVGFPHEHLVIGRLSGVRDDVIPLALVNDYSVLGTATYTFLVQSGTQRVVVVVIVDISFHFSLAKFEPFELHESIKDKAYVVLDRDTIVDRLQGAGPELLPYARTFCIRRKGYGTGDGTNFSGDLTEAERGYSLPSHASLRYTFLASTKTRPVGIPDIGEPPDTVYDVIMVEYVGALAGVAAGSSSATQVFATTAANLRVTLTVYWNIHLDFLIAGTDTSPRWTVPAYWSIEKSYDENEYAFVGDPYQYVVVDPQVAAQFSVQANGAVTAYIGNNISGDLITRGLILSLGGTSKTAGESLGISTGVAIAGATLSVTSNHEHLNKLDSILLRFTAYTHNVERKYTVNGTAVTDVPATVNRTHAPIRVLYEVLSPHFLRTRRDNYLQWDNDWEQHVWCKTNPDAAVSDSFGITELTDGNIDGLSCEKLRDAGDGFSLLRLSHAQLQRELDAYAVTVTGTVPSLPMQHGVVISRLMGAATDESDNQRVTGSTQSANAWKVFTGSRGGDASSNFWASNSGAYSTSSGAPAAGSSGEWWQVDFLSPTPLDAIRMMANTSDYTTASMPRNFTISGTNTENPEESDFTVITSFAGISWRAAEWKLFHLPDAVAYRYYRITITGVTPGSVSYATIGELEFIQDLRLSGTLSAYGSTLTSDFRVCVYHVEHVRNEIVPRMVGAALELDSADRIVTSAFEVRDSWMATDDEMAKVFNRSDVEEGVSVTFSSGRARLSNVSSFEDRGSTFSFIVEFDAHYPIRSWNYSVKGRKNIACGFLIEGQTVGYHAADEWAVVGASTDYSHRPSLTTTDGSVVIDYATLTPRPWKRLRITVSEVRDANGYTPAITSPTLSGTYRVGQFQFYCGYPMLSRVTSHYGQGETNAVYQLNTFSAQYKHVRGENPYITSGVFDGVLPTDTQLAEGYGGPVTDTGLGNTSAYRDVLSTHWNYTLVRTVGDTTLPQLWSTEAKLGLVLDDSTTANAAFTGDAPRVVGVRYDTGLVSGRTAVGALVFGMSDQSHTTTSALNIGGNFTAKLVISAWRFLGLGDSTALAGVDTLNLDAAAVAKLETCAVEASKVVFDDHPDVLVHGTTLLRNNNVTHDYRLVRYNGPTMSVENTSSNPADWENIGNDIIIHVTAPTLPDILPDTSEGLLQNGGAKLDTITAAWHDLTGYNITEKIAFTNPSDGGRLFYSTTTDWVQLSESLTFDAYRGRQIYRNLDDSAIKSVRIHVPGLADTFHYNSGGQSNVLALLGDVQLFELFRNTITGGHPGVDVAFKDIQVRVDGSYRSIQYGDTVYLPWNATSLFVRCAGAAISGSDWTSASFPVYALRRDGEYGASSTSWVQMTTAGAEVFLETRYTTTTVTLYYRAGSTAPSTVSSAVNSRMIPFFSFLIVRAE